MRSSLIRPLAVAAAASVTGRPGPAAAESLDPTERAIVAHVDAHRAEARALLTRAVNINSGTMNVEGVRAVGALFRKELDALGFETRWVSMPKTVNRAGHLFAKRTGTRGKKVLLIGHLDTVFEPDSPFQKLTIEGATARGPGAVDMKGGDVVIITALKALKAAGALEGAAIVVAFTGDEEKAGRPLAVSRKDLIEAGKWADVALGFEQTITVNGVAHASVGRRSSTSWTLEVTGRQGHSSAIFSEHAGAGAIFEAARILNAFYEQVRGEKNLTFNAGTILGGTQVTYNRARGAGRVSGKTNVIARRAIVHGGLRALSSAQQERAQAKMRAIVAESLPVTSARIEFGNGYPPMTPTAGNEALLTLYSRASRDLGLGPVKAYDPAKRGAADISFVAPYADCLAGLGADGTGSHSRSESLKLDSLPAATKRAAIMLYRLTRGPSAGDGR